MTTEVLRLLYTPRVDPRATRIAATVRASHGAELARLATDAATGHPGQVLRWGREESGDTVRSLFYQPHAGTRFARLRAYIGRPFESDGLSYVKLLLAITDGVTTVEVGGTGDAEIPQAFRGTEQHYIGGPFTEQRIASTNIVEGWLDLDALVTAGLSSTDNWRVTLTSDRDATTDAWVELVTLEEFPRFEADDSETLGAVSGAHNPRAPIADGPLERIQTSIDGAVDSSLRTYHCCAKDQGAPLTLQQNVAWKSLTGYSESTDVSLTFTVRGRKAVDLTQSRFRWRVRYKIETAAANADVRCTTGEGDYDIELTDTSGSWADSAVGTGYLAAGAEDTMKFYGKQDDAGSVVSIATITVWEYPEAS